MRATENVAEVLFAKIHHENSNSKYHTLASNRIALVERHILRILHIHVSLSKN